MSDHKTLLNYKKSLKDWHYDPSIKSIDCQYVGRIKNDLSLFLKNIDWGPVEHGVDIWPEDKLKPMNVENLSWGKKDNITAGYTEHNTKKYQLFNSPAIPEIFYKIAKSTGLENYSVTLFKQPPGQINPWHFDTYQGVVNKYKKDKAELSNEEIKSIKRYLICLEDWNWGHFLQIGNNVLSQWRAGDIYTWEYGMYHTSGNAGQVPKYTAQITGLPKNNAWHNSGEFEFYV